MSGAHSFAIFSLQRARLFSHGRRARDCGRDGPKSRQGVANLYRPATRRALSHSRWASAHSLSARCTWCRAHSAAVYNRRIGGARERDLLDVQQDQEAGSIRSSAQPPKSSRRRQSSTMRIAAINGKKVSDIRLSLADCPDAPMGLRREFRSTFRTKPAASETIIGGKWFRDDALRVAPDTGQISLEDASPRSSTSSSRCHRLERPGRRDSDTDYEL